MDNLGQLLLERFENCSDAPALNDTGGMLSYRVLAGNALRVASALRLLGISEYEPVLVTPATQTPIKAAKKYSPINVGYFSTVHN
jgi:non-ribosomal peptide synthetase component E (peptide arylation enzyme)